MHDRQTVKLSATVSLSDLDFVFFYHMNRQTTDLSFHFSPLTLFFHHLLPPVTFQVEVHDRRAPHHSQPPEATGRLDETAGWDEHQGSVK